MTDENLYDYLYVVEWDASVHRPPFTVMHKIKLNPGVKPEDFEKFMAEEGFACVGSVKTRAGAVAAQHLLTDATGNSPQRFEELDFHLDPFGTRVSVATFSVAGRVPSR